MAELAEPGEFVGHMRISQCPAVWHIHTPHPDSSGHRGDRSGFWLRVGTVFVEPGHPHKTLFRVAYSHTGDNGDPVPLIEPPVEHVIAESFKGLQRKLVISTLGFL
ncbi:MAG: Uncharacterised protein [Cellulomonadaceae bacterium TMED98]|nr:MAG: Uncharacterised protein [Cellulomonadaceae bacterium TMED98]